MKQILIALASVLLAGCATDSADLPRLTLFYGDHVFGGERSTFLRGSSVIMRCSRADAEDRQQPVLRQVYLSDGGPVPAVGAPLRVAHQPDEEHQRLGDEVVLFFVRMPELGLALYCGVEVYGESVPAWDMTLAELETEIGEVEQHRRHLQNTPRGRGLF